MKPRLAGFTRKQVGWIAVALIVLLIAAVTTSRLLSRQRSIPAPPALEIELTLNHEGTTYKLYRGDVYTVGPQLAEPAHEGEPGVREVVILCGDGAVGREAFRARPGRVRVPYEMSYDGLPTHTLSPGT